MKRYWFEMSAGNWFDLEKVEAVSERGTQLHFWISGQAYLVAFDKRDAFLEALGIVETKSE